MFAREGLEARHHAPDLRRPSCNMPKKTYNWTQSPVANEADGTRTRNIRIDSPVL